MLNNTFCTLSMKKFMANLKHHMKLKGYGKHFQCEVCEKLFNN